MQNFGHIEAVKLSLERKMDRIGALPEWKIKVQKPSDPWLAAIILESHRLSKLTEVSASQIIHVYNRQVKTDIEVDGRVINPANPVQLSGGILDAIKVLEELDNALLEAEVRIESYEEMASFGNQDVYEEVAKQGLNFSRTIIPRIRLFAQTYLWILWTHEALGQANQFGGQLLSEYNFKGFSEAAFPYIAHPPLIVATIACTSMIEEVGAKYVNSYVSGKDFPPDETSAGSVLKKLEEYHPKSGNFDTEGIREHVIDARNDISHYVTSRGDVVRIEDFEAFHNAVIEGVEFVDLILTDLINQPISDFRDQLGLLPV